MCVVESVCVVERVCVYVEEKSLLLNLIIHKWWWGGWVGLRCHRCSFCAHLFEVGLEEVWEFVGFADGKLSGVGVEFGRADEKRESEFESAVVK